MKYIYILLTILSFSVGYGQVSYIGNGNTGFGDVLGSSSLQFSDNGTTITGVFTKGAGDFNDAMVIYIDTGDPGRNVIDNSVNDQDDPLRRAISSAGPDASDITFPTGFVASYAIAIDVNFGGLWSIPANGNLGDDDLDFVTSVGNPSSNTASSFTFSFDYSQIGLTDGEPFSFVITYLNAGNGFLSNEGYGLGFPSSNPGSGPLTITGNFNYPFYYVNDLNGWQPQDPSGISTASDDLLIESGTGVISSNTTANSVLVFPESVLDLDADINANNIIFSSLLSGGQVSSAQLADASGVSINSLAQTQIYIPAQTNDTRAFRFLTSSVNSVGSIFQNWQNGGQNLSGIGTHITGDVNGNDGFDATATGNPSMYTFDNTFTGNQDNAWNPIPNTDNTNLEAGRGYRIFIRGDRNYDLSSDPPNAPNSDVTLQALGNLVTGNQTFSLSQVQDYYSLVGNPYQSIVNINDVQSTNMNTNFYWVWDPNMSTRGAYVAVDLSTGDSQTPAGNPSSSAANQFVMPGQSLFVQTVNNGAADITFTEASKDVNATPTAVFSDNEQASINLKLYKPSELNNDEFESDAIQINFNDQFNNAATNQDADKLTNPDENLARSIDGELLSIEKRSMPVDNETLDLFTSGYTVDNYVFVADITNLPSDVNAYLVDTHTGDQTLLNEGENQISFSIDQSSPSSIATDRFSLEFEVETFGIDDNEVADKFKVYPNPVDNEKITVQVTNMSGEVNVDLFNMIGQRVMSTQGELNANAQMTLNIGDQSSGVYFIELDQDGQTFKERLIIK